VQKLKLFISYSRKDIQAAAKIEQKLQEHGFDTWRDLSDIDPGVNWSRESANSLADSDIIVLLWSEHAATSRTVKNEWLTARALEKGIIPCFLEPLENLPDAFKLPQVLEHINGISFTEAVPQLILSTKKSLLFGFKTLFIFLFRTFLDCWTTSTDFETGINSLIKILKDPESIDRTYDYMKLPPHAVIPFRPNPDFVGRHTELLDLYLSLICELNVVAINQVVNVFGLGGIGKTQLAVEFAYRFAFAFPEGVLWLNAARDWQTEFACAARKLGLTVEDPTSSDADTRLLHKLQGYISEHKSMLVVMDNVADPSKLDDEVLPGFVPTALGCCLMFTSRSQALPVNAKALEVEVLSDDAAFELLTKGNPPALEEEVSAQKICATLGNLPLAVELAGAYLREKRGTITYAVYLKNLEAHRLQILEEKRKGFKPAVHEDPSLLATFESQYELLEDENAQYVFKLAGQFPEAAMIPVARLGLLAGIEDQPESLETPLDDAFKFLVRISLVEQLQNYQLRLHPLVREFAERLIAKEKRVEFLNRAAVNLHTAYKDVSRLEREYIERGIDSVIDDVQVAIVWCKTGTQHVEDLTNTQRILDRERHNLRVDAHAATPVQLDTFLLQQLHYQAHSMGMDSLAKKCCAALATKDTLSFKMCGSGGFEDPAGIRTFEGHSDSVTAVSMSKDGKVAISGSFDLILWDVATGRNIRTFKGHSGWVKAVSMSEDGKVAISGSFDTTLILWDVATGRNIRTFKGHSGSVKAVSMSEDGKIAISGSLDTTLILWDVATGRNIRTFKGHSGSVDAVSMSKDGKVAISGSFDTTLILWDVATGRNIRTFKGHLGSVKAVSMSKDGKVAISGSFDLILWDVATGRPIRTFKGHSGWVNAVSMSEDGKVAISGSDDNTLILWDVATGRPIRTFNGHSDWVTAVSMSEDGKIAISGSDDNTLILWDVAIGRHIRTFSGHSDWVTAVSMSEDGKVAISGSSDNTLILWDVATGRPIRTFNGHSGWVNAVSMSEDGKVAISGYSDNTLILWDVATGRPIRTFNGHLGPVKAVSTSEDGKVAISGSSDKTLILWDVATGRPIRTFNGHLGPVKAVSMSEDGKIAISGSDDNTLILWDVATGRPIRTFNGHSGWVKAVSMSEDGKVAISGSDDNTLILWDVATGRHIRTFKGHSNGVSAVSMSEDGKVAISSSSDNTLILWDVATGRILRRLFVKNPVLCLSMVRTRVAFGDRAGLVQFFELIG
jgi:WD40 repeat protein